MTISTDDHLPPWTGFRPVDRATIVFVFRGDEVLLIRKKRGLGAGKVNGPGGRLEPGESGLECAYREIEEELCVRAIGLSVRGELRFQFADGHSIHAFVYRADEFEGTPTETDEAIPLWTPVTRVPYEEMWADDGLWFPHLLANQPFRGRFLFDGDQMLAHELRLEAPSGEFDAP